MPREWYRRLGASLAALLAFLLSTASPAAAESGSHVVEAYQVALDRRDLEGALRLFDPDAEVMVGLPTPDDVPVRIAAGRQQVRAWLRELIADGSRLVLQDRPQLEPQVVGAHISWPVELDEGSLGRPVSGRIRVFVRDGRIVRLGHIFAREDVDTLAATWLTDGRAASAEPAIPPAQAVWVAVGAVVVVALAFGHRAPRGRATREVRRPNLLAGLRRAYHLESQDGPSLTIRRGERHVRRERAADPLGAAARAADVS